MITRLCRLWFAAFALVALMGSGTSTAMAQEEKAFQWILFADTPQQSALAIDGSKILIAGTGTFDVEDAKHVTGGGTWAAFDSSGVATGSGNFQVTSLIKFDLAPGSASGHPTFHAGLALMRIAHDDGSKGVLAVSCSLNFFGLTTPPSVPEGFTATKGFVYYWDGFINGDSIFIAIPGHHD